MLVKGLGSILLFSLARLLLEISSTSGLFIKSINCLNSLVVSLTSFPSDLDNNSSTLILLVDSIRLAACV